MAAKFVQRSGIDQADRLATLTKVAIVIFTGAILLKRMGLAPSIVNFAFGTLLGGLGLAAAIAFGWGGRDAAKRLIDRHVALAATRRLTLLTRWLYGHRVFISARADVRLCGLRPSGSTTRTASEVH